MSDFHQRTKRIVEKSMQNVKGVIDELGFMVFGMNTFCYTAGLSKRGLPEIIISSDNPEMNYSIICSLVDEWCANGYRKGQFDDLLCYNKDVEADIPLAVHPVPFNENLHANYVTQTINFYKQFPEYVGENGVKFVQAFWPDDKGRLPFEEGYNTNLIQDDIAKATLTSLEVH